MQFLEFASTLVETSTEIHFIFYQVVFTFEKHELTFVSNFEFKFPNFVANSFNLCFSIRLNMFYFMFWKKVFLNPFHANCQRLTFSPFSLKIEVFKFICNM